MTLDEHEDVETSFLILPSAFPDFRDFNDFQDVTQELLKLMDRVGTYQLVGFHPRYQFAGTTVEDPWVRMWVLATPFRRLLSS